MTIIRPNGKVTTTTRALRRDRRHARKSNARQTSEHHLANTRLQNFNYAAKQSRRWLRARLLSKNRGYVSKDVALQVQKYFEKTEFQLQHPRISDPVLTTDAKRVLSEFELERDAARDEQGHPERVEDWWAAPTVSGKKKGKGTMTGTKEGDSAAGSVTVEGLGDDVGDLVLGGEEEMEEEDGGCPLEEEGFRGFDTPVMLSPMGSVVGEGDEEDEE